MWWGRWTDKKKNYAVSPLSSILLVFITTGRLAACKLTSCSWGEFHVCAKFQFWNLLEAPEAPKGPRILRVFCWLERKVSICTYISGCSQNISRPLQQNTLLIQHCSVTANFTHQAGEEKKWSTLCIWGQFKGAFILRSDFASVPLGGGHNLCADWLLHGASGPKN